MEYIGSKWRKWDLHVHTPISIKQGYGGNEENSWIKFVEQIENLKEPYSVIGVNDYFTIEGYKKLKEFQNQGKLQKVILFPVIELRVRAFGNLSNDDAWKRVNLHILFDNINIEKIETQFLNLLKFDYTTFSKTGLTRDNITEFGNNIIQSMLEEKRNGASPLETGFNSLNFDHREVCTLLEQSGLNYLIAIGKAEWDAMRWEGSIAEKKDIVERSHFMFTAAANVFAHKKSVTSIKQQGYDIPLLDCSDAHTFSDKIDSNNNPIKDRLGNCFTWIKADKTFEGLRQVIYEPASRLFINESKPIPPPRKIDFLKIYFPNDTTIIRNDDRHLPDKSAEFCLRGNREIHFSPYFTCIIGGRGAGKSTILNIIAKKLGQDDSFFKTNILRSYNGTETNKEIKELDDFISIGGTNEIEYISQNEVELFAQDKEKLTAAIYDRLSQKSDKDFSPFESKIEKNISLINRQLKDVSTIYEKKVELKSVEKLLENDQKIVNSFDNPTYSNLTNEINRVGSLIERTNIAKQRYTDLITLLSDLTDKFDFKIDDANLIEKEIENVVNKLRTILNEKFGFVPAEEEIKNLSKKQLDLSQELENYLKSQGLSQENINDYERATRAVPQYATQINNLKSEIKEIAKALDIFKENSKTFFDDRNSLEIVIRETLEPFNIALKSKNSNVKDIKFVYEFDYEKAKEIIFETFWSYFDNKRPKDFGLNSPSDAVNRYLFENDPIKVLEQTREVFCSRYELKGKSEKGETQAKQYLQKLFETEVNFEIYKLLILRCCINPLEFKGITGFYDNRELKSCSFGQRCTAVIVALLNFGNKPLLIDEPEAHLDSKLIAEYLVDLVKQRKQERQIIFATHNANFVVNGDAELVLHLEVDENNETLITPVSIENIGHREKLLLLEGGEEAFRKRDRRLIKN